MRQRERFYEGYDKDVLLSRIEKFNAFRNGNHVSTHFDGRSLKEAEVSNQYQFFDFKQFAMMVIELIAKQTNICFYNLKITRGIQEISLLVNPIHINGDLYYQNLYLLNSNDRSRALQFNAGLLRWNNKTGSVVPVAHASTSQKAIHRGYTFNEKVEDINLFIENLPSLVAEQIEIVKNLSDKEVSVKSIINTLLNERMEGVKEITPTALGRAKSFIFRMFQNMDMVDLIDLGIGQDEIKTLKNPLDFVKAGFDLHINLYDAFTWYTEIYKNRDSAIIKRESFRFFELAEKFDTKEIISEELQEEEIA